MSKQTRTTISIILRYGVLCVVGIVMFYPMLWMFGASLKESNN